MSSIRVGLCPMEACDEPVTLADLQAVEGGAPIWTCSGGHHGPRVTGFDRDEQR